MIDWLIDWYGAQSEVILDQNVEIAMNVKSLALIDSYSRPNNILLY